MSILLNREEAKAGNGFSRREENFSKKYEKGGESQCEERKNEDETKPSLLLHSCRGPCSTAVIERLADRYRLKVYFYNPNITDPGEYERRLKAQRQVIEKFNRDRSAEDAVALFEGTYDPERFLKAVQGLEGEPENGARCDVCFRLRMEETARVAERQGFDEFATTLSVSPHKNTGRINAVGYELEKNVSASFLDESFKKRDGFRRSVELSKEYGIYRQNYCGCVFSKRD